MNGQPDDREDLLQRLLESSDEPCPACGYNLRGLRGGSCPECGEALTLRVGMVDPRMGMYLAGLIGLACGTGFCGMILAWAVPQLLFARYGPPARILVPLGLGLGACGWSMMAWLGHRAWIRRRTPRQRAFLVAGCWVLAAGCAVAFFGSAP